MLNIAYRRVLKVIDTLQNNESEHVDLAIAITTWRKNNVLLLNNLDGVWAGVLLEHMV